jgi:hypothetical protein
VLVEERKAGAFLHLIKNCAPKTIAADVCVAEKKLISTDRATDTLLFASINLHQGTVSRIYLAGIGERKRRPLIYAK